MEALAGPCPIRQVRRALPSKPHPPNFSPLILTVSKSTCRCHRGVIGLPNDNDDAKQSDALVTGVKRSALVEATKVSSISLICSPNNLYSCTKRDDEVNWASYDQVLKSLTCSITVLLLSSSGKLHRKHKHFSHPNAFAGRSTDWN